MLVVERYLVVLFLLFLQIIKSFSLFEKIQWIVLFVGVKIPENHINKHLDSCLSREEKKESLRR